MATHANANCTLAHAQWVRENLMGTDMEVTKGKDKGARGVMRWLGLGKWGLRVGLAIEGRDGLLFVAWSNIARGNGA